MRYATYTMMKRIIDLWRLKREVKRLARRLQWQRRCNIEMLLYYTGSQHSYHRERHARQKAKTEEALNEATTKYLRLKLRLDEKTV
jgi:hypothetical protein